MRLLPHYTISGFFLIIVFSLCSVLSVCQDMQLSESKTSHTLGVPKAPETALEVTQDAHELKRTGSLVNIIIIMKIKVN